MTNLDTLKGINGEIAAFIERAYADTGASLLDVPSPHALAHTVAANYPDLGAAFYHLVAEAAREVLIGGERDAPATIPHVTGALAGLVDSKDSSWF